MTSLLLFIKHHFPGIWWVIEWLNGRLFSLRYPEWKDIAGHILREQFHPEFQYSLVTIGDLEALADFLAAQSRESFTYFDPHRFDGATLGGLLQIPSFLMMKITQCSDNRIVGYFFLRGFFIGRAFHGLIVDTRIRNRGLGTSMWAISQRICLAGGFRMFATLSVCNRASMGSAVKGTSVRIVKELPDHYLLIECKPKESCVS